MLYSILTALGGMYLLVGFWLAAQWWFRRHSPELPPDADVLQGRMGGCHSCPSSASCSQETPDCDADKH